VGEACVLRTKRRDALKEHLKGQGIESAVHYPVPVHRMPYIEDPPLLPQTDSAVSEILSIPMHPLMSDEEVHQVIEGVRSFF
jgi:UDP-2-acetamido-2-deoxy-ribo-hexuluronate aminotransferase